MLELTFFSVKLKKKAKVRENIQNSPIFSKFYWDMLDRILRKFPNIVKNNSSQSREVFKSLLDLFKYLELFSSPYHNVINIFEKHLKKKYFIPYISDDFNRCSINYQIFTWRPVNCITCTLIERFSLKIPDIVEIYK